MIRDVKTGVRVAREDFPGPKVKSEGFLCATLDSENAVPKVASTRATLFVNARLARTKIHLRVKNHHGLPPRRHDRHRHNQLSRILPTHAFSFLLPHIAAGRK